MPRLARSQTVAQATDTAAPEDDGTGYAELAASAHGSVAPGDELLTAKPATSNATCQLVADDAGYYGFYRTDPWPEGQVVLTFDDGPHVVHTPRVLGLLQKHGLVATFFVVGRAINRHTYHIVQGIVSEGHTLGSHTYDHDINMAFRNHSERGLDYIQGQHEVTQILVDLALLADSADDFDQLYTRVFAKRAGAHLRARELRHEWRDYRDRHRTLLAGLGYEGEARPYPIVYSRPPGGGPYLGNGPNAATRHHDRALARLGLLNVMWHGGAGDTGSRRHELGYLLGNIRYNTRRGGILLVHDQIRNDALAAGLERLANDPQLHVVPLAVAVERKFGCDPTRLAKTLSGNDTGVLLTAN